MPFKIIQVASGNITESAETIFQICGAAAEKTTKTHTGLRYIQQYISKTNTHPGPTLWPMFLQSP